MLLLDWIWHCAGGHSLPAKVCEREELKDPSAQNGPMGDLAG